MNTRELEVSSFQTKIPLQMKLTSGFRYVSLKVSSKSFFQGGVWVQKRTECESFDILD